MDIIRQISGFILGLIFPAFAAYPLVKTFLKMRNSRFLPILMAFPLGWAWLTISFFLGNLIFGIKISLYSGISILCVSYLIGLILKKFCSTRQKGSTDEGGRVREKTAPPNPAGRSIFSDKWMLCLLGVAFIFWCAVAIIAMGTPVECIPGCGVWGYKALEIFHSGEIPFGMLSGQGRPYLHQDYPLLLAWEHSCMGEFNDHLIKLLPYFSALLCFLMLTTIFAEVGVSAKTGLLISLFASSGGTFVLCATNMYADLILLLFSMPGFFLIHRYFLDRKRPSLFFALLFMGMSGWIKSEGIVYLGLPAFYLAGEALFFRRDVKKFFDVAAALIFVVGIFLMPWRICVEIFDLPFCDFSLSRPFLEGLAPCFETLLMAWKRVLSMMFVSVTASGGIWILISAGVFAQFFSRRDSGKWFALYFIVGGLFIFTGIFFFSIRPPAWHINSLARLLMPLGTMTLPFLIRDIFAHLESSRTD